MLFSYKVAPKRAKGWSSSNCFAFLWSLQCSFWVCLDVKPPAPESLSPWHVEGICLCSCTIYFGAAMITRKGKLRELHLYNLNKTQSDKVHGTCCLSFLCQCICKKKGKFSAAGWSKDAKSAKMDFDNS